MTDMIESIADLEMRRAIQREIAMQEFEREPFAALERYIAAMVANGYTTRQAAARCREMVTDALISRRRATASDHAAEAKIAVAAGKARLKAERDAAVQDRRDALRVVDAIAADGGTGDGSVARLESGIAERTAERIARRAARDTRVNLRRAAKVQARRNAIRII